ncbi:hypothetical protein [Candidatus Similichlamydia epinepheli]|uniref:hypothetical protein n=1 Tax=Candidatus Similichlamydia epinepheli TaxID=1903953 RepID=UPI000D34C333|nr:hypothetical protein [Candidatus Similichlamydia epinepheli]
MSSGIASSPSYFSSRKPSVLMLPMFLLMAKDLLYLSRVTKSVAIRLLSNTLNISVVWAITRICLHFIPSGYDKKLINNCPFIMRLVTGLLQSVSLLLFLCAIFVSPLHSIVLFMERADFLTTVGSICFVFVGILSSYMSFGVLLQELEEVFSFEDDQMEQETSTNLNGEINLNDLCPPMRAIVKFFMWGNTSICGFVCFVIFSLFAMLFHSGFATLLKL